MTHNFRIALFTLLSIVGGILALSLTANADNGTSVLIPANANEVEACFDYADTIHDNSGGEDAYNVCASNVPAYEAWQNADNEGAFTFPEQ